MNESNNTTFIEFMNESRPPKSIIKSEIDHSCSM